MAEQGRIRTSRQYTEPTPEHIFEDHDWVQSHHDALLQKYGECFLMVYNKQVIATGKTEEEAVQNAEANLSDQIERIQLMPEWIGQRHPFQRAFPGHFRKPPTGQ
jgi:hypothetical protein